MNISQDMGLTKQTNILSFQLIMLFTISFYLINTRNIVKTNSNLHEHNFLRPVCNLNNVKRQIHPITHINKTMVIFKTLNINSIDVRSHLNVLLLKKNKNKTFKNLVRQNKTSPIKTRDVLKKRLSRFHSSI